MNVQSVIKKAILSEKAYKQMEKGIYTFLVDVRSTKQQIAQAVEKQFATKVKKVNVFSKATKQKRIGGTRKQVATGGGKKAIVYLSHGQSIPMLMPKTEGKTKAKKTKTQEKPKEKSLLSKIRGKKESEKEKK